MIENFPTKNYERGKHRQIINFVSSVIYFFFHDQNRPYMSFLLQTHGKQFDSFILLFVFHLVFHSLKLLTHVDMHDISFIHYFFTTHVSLISIIKTQNGTLNMTHMIHLHWKLVFILGRLKWNP